MKGKKGIIRANQKKQERNSDDDKLDQICMALADCRYSFQRNVFLVFERRHGKLIDQGTKLKEKYRDQKKYQINNCDIVVWVEKEFFYIELDGEAIHGSCDCESTIEPKTRERNRRYEKAGLSWFAISESLLKFTGLKNNIGNISTFLTLSYIQKIIAKNDN